MFTLLSLGLLTSVLASEDLSALHSLPRSRRAFGGENAAKGEFPFIARIKGSIPETLLFGWIPIGHFNLYCGGSVINRRWIVTAAHCAKTNKLDKTYAMIAKYWHSMVGEIELKTGWSGWVRRVMKSTIDVHAEKLFVHPEYKESNTWENDLMLIKLRSDLPISSNPRVDTIKLPEHDQEFPMEGQTCSFVGWGCTTENGQPSKVLQKVDLPSISNSTCRNLYGTSMTTRLCAGNFNNGKGLCPGDSGGPLFCQDARDGNQWKLAGIASFTSVSNPANRPGAFTKVSKYINWITKTINDN